MYSYESKYMLDYNQKISKKNFTLVEKITKPATKERLRLMLEKAKIPGFSSQKYFIQTVLIKN